ncbi:hypothetical protein IMZ48_37450, partial [Candidatus Bathyarchaeota archaeon]|nr:hypothetical protein [Candidatus Bathyarchaeota archaeon]
MFLDPASGVNAASLRRSDPPTQKSENGSLHSSSSSNSSGNSSRNSLKVSTALKAFRRHPSVLQLRTRVRPASGSSMSSDSSTETVRPSLHSSPDPFPLLPTSPARSQHSRDLGIWDRTVDVVYHEYPRGAPRPDKSLDFERSVDLFLSEHDRTRSPAARGYFALPAALRFKIWEYVIEANSGDRPVALNKCHWYKDAWRQGEFSTLQDAMKSLQPCLEVSFEFRADALVSFLMMRRFHVIYDPCIGPLLNPLATAWVDKYYPYMQDIALEISLTQYRFGMSGLAHLLSPGTTNMGNLIQNFVQAQLKRRSVSTLKSLV